MSTSALAARQNAKHEKILRELSKLEGNRQCMTCQGHGGRAPQYACTTFGTFVCTTCSGVHREFQFRVKSISNSHFTPEEVKTMQDAGNDAARARYLAGWYGTPHERSCSLVENTKREPLKNFIRQVFHERKFEGDAAPPAQAQAQAQAYAAHPNGAFGHSTPTMPPVRAPAATPAPANDDPFGLGGFASPPKAQALYSDEALAI